MTTKTRPAVVASLRRAFAYVALAAVAILTYVRLYFGVDFTDESFYVAVPYRFVFGARPLIDEATIASTMGVLLYPFVLLWNSVVGTSGIILYARHLHLFFCAGVSLALFVSLRRILGDQSLSLVLAGAAVAFVPFGIHGLSYNTFSSGFFTAGSFLGLAWLWRGTRRSLFTAGAALGLAVFTYPSFILPVACFLLVLGINARPQPLRRLVPGLVPVALGVFATVAFLVHRGFGTSQELVERTTKFGEQGGGIDKTVDVLNFVSSSFPHKYLAAGLLLGSAALRLWKPAVAAAPLLFLPFAALPPDLGTSASSNQFVTNAGLLAPALFLLCRDRILGKRLLAVVWLPAAIAGLTTALSSGGGGNNVAIGFFPALIVTGVFLGLAARDAAPDTLRLRDLAPVVVLVFTGIALQYSYVYRDADIRALTVPIVDGPYAGTFTTEEKRDFIHVLDRVLGDVSGSDCRIVFYDEFPGGYLFNHGRPHTNATWLIDVAHDREDQYQRLLLDYYAKHGGLPDVVVRVARIPVSPTETLEREYGADEPLERALRGAAYVLAHDNHLFRVLRKRDSACEGGRE